MFVKFMVDTGAAPSVYPTQNGEADIEFLIPEVYHGVSGKTYFS